MVRRRREYLAAIALFGILIGTIATRWPMARLLSAPAATPGLTVDQRPARDSTTTFLVTAGGGAPSYNEIALEKNVRYFQRTLAHLGWNPAIATIFFANGTDGRPTIRYLDIFGRERFKVPDIEHLSGAATKANVQQWFQAYPQTANGVDSCPTFFYFTGHGALNRSNPDNNAMILWEETFLSVQELATLLEEWPADIPFVTMMAQCYAGSFANIIYEDGDPTQPVALQTRCGFFATVKTRPSVGCTPLVNEADYRDYSSSFFAGLSGRDRVGNSVTTADYDANGTISFAEAHAFAKVDGETSDWPISTSEAWLQRQASEAHIQEILKSPLQTWATQGRPEQRYVIETLAATLGYDLQRSFADRSEARRRWFGLPETVRRAYDMRLRMELISVGTEQRLRASGESTSLATLQQLLACEAGHW